MDISSFPGLGFHPNNDQLLTHYLKNRIVERFHGKSQSAHSHIVPDIDLYTMHPRDLPLHFQTLTVLKSNGKQWVFFCARKEKYRNSKCSSRTVPNVGYWKITTKTKDVKSESTGKVIGSRNILTFYDQCGPKKTKTYWILHEYHLNASCLGYDSVAEMPFTVCRLYNKRSDADPLACEDQSTGPANPEDGAHTSPGITDEQEIWNPLREIQQLPDIGLDYNAGSFFGRGEYHDNNETDPFFGRPSSGYYDASGSGYPPYYTPSYCGPSY
ncbi:hypothetical protein SAY86_023530 [Trapa natans]|uniref:NAC domain-containing protein n=1 Tax=Trapa natans TaxID=22666 RepID=A0AAN7LV51_TRANT|nr:hypothetical protein SAY86_023530 [Trapa natans]